MRDACINHPDIQGQGKKFGGSDIKAKIKDSEHTHRARRASKQPKAAGKGVLCCCEAEGQQRESLGDSGRETVLRGSVFFRSWGGEEDYEVGGGGREACAVPHFQPQMSVWTLCGLWLFDDEEMRSVALPSFLFT